MTGTSWQRATTEVSTPDALAFYANGWFPAGRVAGPGTPLRWQNPDPRCIVDLRARTWRHYLATARRASRTSGFELRRDTAFDEVLAGCAVGRTPGEGTWLDDAVLELYRRLFDAGVAHSTEAWCDGELVAGALCMNLGRWLSIESMFHRVSNGGHGALVSASELLAERRCTLLDLQELHRFTKQLGGVEIPRDGYLRLLRAALSPTDPVS